MNLKRALPALVLLLVPLACGKMPDHDAGTSNANAPSAGDATPPPLWDDAIGATIATPSPAGPGIVAFTRDTSARTELVDLFSHAGTTTRATIRIGAGAARCGWERSAAMTTNGASPAVNGWSLALTPNHATPVAVDGITDLTARDSAALVARLSRLVSALPEDSTSAPFRGLPIVIREAWRTSHAGGTVVVALAARTLNMESNPRAELVTIVAELAASADPSSLNVAWFRRASGPEEKVEATDLLAALQLHDGAPALALLHEDPRGAAVEILARDAAGPWRTRWASDALGCRN